MYCGKCGEKLNDGAKFCKKCGTPTYDLKPQTQKTEVLRSNSKPYATNSSGVAQETSGNIAVTIALSIGVIICSVTSWIQLLGEKYTVRGLVSAMRDISGFVGKMAYYGGSMDSEAEAMLFFVKMLAYAAYLIPIVYAVHIYFAVKKKNGYYAGGYTILVSVIFIIAVIMGGKSIQSGMNSIIDLGSQMPTVIGVTFMPYLTCGLAACDVFISSKARK